MGLLIIDFKRSKIGIEGIVESIQYDPNRSSNLALIKYKDGDWSYILSPEGLKVGDTVEGFATSKIVHQNAQDLGIKLKLLDYLMSIYEGSKSITEDKSIFNASEIEPDSNFKLK